jgi:hypothetical protein
MSGKILRSRFLPAKAGLEMKVITTIKKILYYHIFKPDALII